MKVIFTHNLRIFVFILILAVYGSLLAHTMRLPAADDLPRQMKIGETILQGNFDIFHKNVYSYTEPDQTFYNHHWLSGVVFYLVHKAVGWSGLSVFKIIVLLTAFVLLFLTALRKADFWVVAFFSIPAIIVMGERTGLRPEVFSYLFLALFLYLLVNWERKPESWGIFWLIPLQILWVNMHVFFSIGIMMVAAFVFEKVAHNLSCNWSLPNIKERWGKLREDFFVRRGLLLLGSLFAVSFLNPRGVNGVFYFYPGDGFPIKISENTSLFEFLRGDPIWDNIQILFFFVLAPLLLASFIIPIWRKSRPFLYGKPIFYFLGSVAVTFLGFAILRSLTLFGMFFLPAISANVGPLFDRVRLKIQMFFPRLSLALGILCVAALISIASFLVFPGWGLLSKFKDRGIGLAPHAEKSARFFKEQGLKGPILNDADIGSYLIYYLYPEEKVFFDNRFADAYSASFVRDTYFPMIADETVWESRLAEYNFNAIFAYHYDAAPNHRNFLFRRINDPLWALVYADPFVVILIRNTEANKRVIEQFQITPDNVGERLAYLTESRLFNDRVSAGDLFNLVGRHDLAQETFLDMLVYEPQHGKVWMILGQMALGYGDETNTVLGAMFLEKAIAERWATAEAYYFLGAAYARMEKTEKAKEVLRKALRKNPDYEDVRILLESL